MKSKLHQYCIDRLRKDLIRVFIHENFRPDWLRGQNNSNLEIDIFMPQFNLAIECQGIQHYKFVEHFHGDLAGFQAQQQRDKLKRKLLRNRGIKLIEFKCEDDYELVVKYITSPSGVKPKHNFRANREKNLSSMLQKASGVYDELQLQYVRKPMSDTASLSRKFYKCVNSIIKMLRCEKNIDRAFMNALDKTTIYVEFAIRKLGSALKEKDRKCLTEFLLFSNEMKKRFCYL